MVERACWMVELNTTCPGCDWYFDITDNNPDFWHSKIQVGESGKIIETRCPICNHEFEVETEY